jgi:hypothetical protein
LERIVLADVYHEGKQVVGCSLHDASVESGGPSSVAFEDAFHSGQEREGAEEVGGFEPPLGATEVPEGWLGCAHERWVLRMGGRLEEVGGR